MANDKHHRTGPRIIECKCGAKFISRKDFTLHSEKCQAFQDAIRKERLRAHIRDKAYKRKDG